MSLTAVFVEVPEGYVAYVEELPGANSQGTTLDEARENLHEAVELILSANRKPAKQALAAQRKMNRRLKVEKEPFVCFGLKGRFCQPRLKRS